FGARGVAPYATGRIGRPTRAFVGWAAHAACTRAPADGANRPAGARSVSRTDVGRAAPGLWQRGRALLDHTRYRDLRAGGARGLVDDDPVLALRSSDPVADRVRDLWCGRIHGDPGNHLRDTPVTTAQEPGRGGTPVRDRQAARTGVVRSRR